ncbi:tRNA-dihydrouridine synthase C [Escherichia coli]|uniref:tRNA-dihydrouridine synthase C n=1 Tax=Escherichia coli TaxID=562 RepID=A0A376SAJ2_ECOLX|nr:tRNA-dihydrouridine synthase C [Escherichia coli]
MRVLLAPMEGVLDSLVRELLTEVNDYDLCITEFVRVVDQLLPVKVFHRICPELQKRQPDTIRYAGARSVVRSVPTMAGRERRPCGGVRFLGRGSQLRLPVENG